MPTYIGNRRIEEWYIGNTSMNEVYIGNTCVFRKGIQIPTKKPIPSSYTEVQVARTDGANYTIYTVPEDGFYRVQVSAGAGGTAYGNANLSYAGGTNQIVYLYKGTKCLLWSGTGGGNGNTDGSAEGVTGYPAPTNDLGATGPDRQAGESGGAGGGAANHGLYGTYAGGHGGAGSGFLAGLPSTTTVPYITHKESAWDYAIDTNRDWTAGSYSVSNLYCYILCGGSGGNSSDNGDTRSGGAGGGAFGNSGMAYDWQAIHGPGGTWGQGENGLRYGKGANGAWCIMDFSRNQWNWGTAGGVSSGNNGYCILTRLVPNN